MEALPWLYVQTNEGRLLLWLQPILMQDDVLHKVRASIKERPVLCSMSVLNAVIEDLAGVSGLLDFGIDLEVTEALSQPPKPTDFDSKASSSVSVSEQRFKLVTIKAVQQSRV